MAWLDESQPCEFTASEAGPHETPFDVAALAHQCLGSAGRLLVIGAPNTGKSTLVAAMADAPGGKPKTLMLDKHSHLSLGYAIGTNDAALTGPILDFVKGLK